MNTLLAYFGENMGAIGMRLLEHVVIVGAAMAAAVAVGVGIGLLLARESAGKIRGVAFYLLGLGQTIPSLAILALAVGVLGIGAFPAIVALFLYALLPIARNTYAGIQGVPEETVDAARGLGMTPGEILRQVELPLAAPMIIGGIRTATVVAISAGTLAYLIGAGGLGDFIFTGIALFKPEAMLAGAIPTALLAIGADWGLGKLMDQFSIYD